jgi:bacillithiol system protein YtxJ
MNWIQLVSPGQIEEIKTKSYERTQVIFKHSTRCSISAMVLNRLNKNDQIDEADFYYLDLIAYRNISNAIAEEFKVYHESPQILVIKNGECIFDESHNAINMDEIMEHAV